MTQTGHGDFCTAFAAETGMTKIALPGLCAAGASASKPSLRALEVAAMFGLDMDDQSARGVTIIPACEIPLPLERGGVALITGPSGSGKSSLLRMLDAALRARGVNVINAAASAARPCEHKTPAAAESTVIDAIAPERSLREALRICSLAGLSDAFVLLRRPEELSDGQRCRFQFALALANAWPTSSHQPSAIIIDEFAATLDRITAAALARNVRRWSTRVGVTFILATTHEDVLEPLEPDVLIHKKLGGGIEIAIGPAQPRKRAARAGAARDEFRIETGTLHDYRALAPFHYRSHHPGAATSVLRIVRDAPTVVGQFLARRSEPAEVVGVLVRSLPALACRLRDVATNHRYGDHLSQRERALMLNDEVRCISRVVIDPRFRALGLATRVVRHALDHPESPRILFSESLAAMGRVSPFFEHAGMRRFDPEMTDQSPALLRLLDALEHSGLSASELTATDHALARLEAMDHADRAWLRREFHRFLRAAARCSRQALMKMTDRDLIIAVRRRIVRPVYFLFQHAVERAAGDARSAHTRDACPC